MSKVNSRNSLILILAGIAVLLLIFCVGLYLFLSGKNPLWGNIISLTGLAGLIAFIFLFVIPKKRT